MLDLCVMRYKKLAQLGEIQIVGQNNEYLLIQSPSDMTYTISVVIGTRAGNGSSRSYTASTFEAVTANLLKVTLPPQLVSENRTEVIATIDVYVDSPNASESDDVELAVTHDTRSGGAKLTQSFVKLLMTTPGSDKFDMESGGGLIDSVRGASVDQPAMIAGIVAGAVQRTVKQILVSQSKRNLPAEEVLVAAQVVGVDVDKPTLSISIRLAVISMGGAEKVVFATTTSGGVE